MTRGRKKDLTIPPSRAVAQQREYRERRLQYISNLEERLRKAEEENDELRQELAALRTEQSSTPAGQSSRTALASELMRDLSTVSTSLARFRQLFPEHRSGNNCSSATCDDPTCPQYASSPTPYAVNTPPYPPPTSCNTYDVAPLGPRVYSQDPSRHTRSPSDDRDQIYDSRASSPLSDCCGGLMDCRDLIDRVDRRVMDDLDLLRPVPTDIQGPSQPTRKH